MRRSWGKEKNKHGWQRTGGKQGGKGKIAVLGMLEREGELRTGVTPTLALATSRPSSATTLPPAPR